MAKWCNDTVLDTFLNYLKNNVDMIYVCSSQPADEAGAISASLADVAVDSSDFTLANGDTSGRKVTVGAQSAVPVDATGSATHIALVDATSALLFVTTCPSTALTSGGTVDLAAFDIEIADPA